MSRAAMVAPSDPRVAAQIDTLDRAAAAFDAEVATADRRAREDAATLADLAHAAAPPPAPVAWIVLVTTAPDVGPDVAPVALH